MTRKSEALEATQKMVRTNQNRLREIDEAIRLRLNGAAGAPLDRTEKDLDHLLELRREHLKRQEFLDRLSFQIDRNFRDGDLKSFLQITTLKMAQTDSQESRGADSLWRFLTYLSIALKDLHERQDRPLELIFDYMNAGGVSQPIKPSEYLAKRDYTNGRLSVEAKPVDRAQLGESLEQTLRVQSGPSEFDQQKPILKPVIEAGDSPTKPAFDEMPR